MILENVQVFAHRRRLRRRQGYDNTSAFSSKTAKLTIAFMDEMFGRNLFLSEKIVEPRFCDYEDEAFGIDRGRLISGLFYILNM